MIHLPSVAWKESVQSLWASSLHCPVWNRTLQVTPALECVLVCAIQSVCAHAQWLSSVWLCNPMDYSPPGSSVHGIILARILEWVAIPFLRDLSHPEIKPMSSAALHCRWTLYWPTWEAQRSPNLLSIPIPQYPSPVHAKLLQLCLTLCSSYGS